MSGTGASTHEVVLQQANLFPYLGGFKTVGNPEVTNSAGGFSFPVPRADQGHKRRRSRLELQRANPDPLSEGVNMVLAQAVSSK